MLNKNPIILSLLFLLCACNTTNRSINNTPKFSASTMSRIMEVGITESEITRRSGWKPNKVEMSTCGSSTPSPWTCKVLTFGVNYDNLLIVYMLPDAPGGEAIINTWQVFGNY